MYGALRGVPAGKGCVENRSGLRSGERLFPIERKYKKALQAEIPA